MDNELEQMLVGDGLFRSGLVLFKKASTKELKDEPNLALDFSAASEDYFKDFVKMVGNRILLDLSHRLTFAEFESYVCMDGDIVNILCSDGLPLKRESNTAKTNPDDVREFLKHTKVEKTEIFDVYWHVNHKSNANYYFHRVATDGNGYPDNTKYKLSGYCKSQDPLMILTIAPFVEVMEHDEGRACFSLRYKIEITNPDNILFIT